MRAAGKLILKWRCLRPLPPSPRTLVSPFLLLSNLNFTCLFLLLSSSFFTEFVIAYIYNLLWVFLFGFALRPVRLILTSRIHFCDRVWLTRPSCRVQSKAVHQFSIYTGLSISSYLMPVLIKVLQHFAWFLL